MIWGETGSRDGANPHQLTLVSWLWSIWGITELHDGDCVGVDEQLYHLAMAFQTDVTIHPPTKPQFRAFCGNTVAGVHPKAKILLAKPYYARDRELVDSSEVITALPKSNDAIIIGGTGYTVNYTREQKKPLAIVWPAGQITYERWISL